MRPVRVWEMIRRLGLWVAVVGVLVFTLFPFYWAINSSLKTGSELFSPSLIPLHPVIGNYLEIFSQQPFGRNILNSVVVASLSVLISLGVAVLAAYALGRIQFKGRKLLLLVILGVSMFPQIAILSGLFELLQFLHLYNSWWGLTLAYMTFTLPFTIWVLTSFMKAIPRGLEEAAIMDCAGPFTIVFRIFFPLLAPSLVTTGLLAFIFAWNEFLFALTFNLTNESRTVPVAIAMISGASQFELPWGHIMAASVVVTLPLIAATLLFQRKIVSGLTSGAIKG